MLSDYPEWARYGAVELKRLYSRNLGRGMAISLALHGAIIAILLLNNGPDDRERTRDHLGVLPTPRGDTLRSIPILLSIKDGGGGSPTVKAPPGPAVKGHPQAVPEKGARRDDPSRSTRVKAPTKVNPVDREKPSTSVVSSDSGRRDAPVAGTAGDRPDGRGTAPAGGSGGAGVGYANGVGARGWASRPRANYPDGSNVEGTVVLRFTVMPNGDIVNISVVKRANQALVNAALASLRRARFRSLPEGAPQEPASGTIPFYFKLE